MPSLNDIALVAEALEKSPIAIVKDRCVVVRNRNSTCRRCMNACANDVIEIYNNEVKITSAQCTSCGACVAVCPTEAVVSCAPTDAQLAADASASLKANDGRVVIACARIASKHVADPARYAEVPCLARIEESLLVALVSRGAREVLLVDGNCATCKYRGCIAHADETIAQARTLVQAQGGRATMRRVSGFPEDLREQDTRGLYGSTRRGFFSDAVGAARDTAMTAAKTTIEQELGSFAGEANIGARLRVNEQGTLPLITMPRHEAAINAMDAIGPAAVDSIDSRLFGSVTIDADRCNACGMCAMFCPTGALRRDEPPQKNKPLLKLEFSACECVQCGLCVDVCWKRALTLAATVRTDELYDFEPVTFDLA